MYKFLKSNNENEIKVLIKKTSGTQRVRGKKNLKGKPFIARMKNGHKGIFQKKENRKIEELKTLSIPQMLGSESVMEYIRSNNEVDNVLEKNLRREVNRILKGYV